MVQRSKRKTRIRKKNEESSNLDQLSSLPDSIISHIFSFLDTRSATRTSVLSKRYRDLWTISPNLDFELPEVPHGCLKSYAVDGFYLPRKNPVNSFQSYVDHVLKRREHINLTSFRLKMHHFTCGDFLLKCVDYAAKHKVQSLRIRAFVKNKPVALPNMLLTSSSLITLHLNNAISSSIDLPKSVLLPNLKVLSLKNFEFSDTNYNGELFSGCPCLEVLVLNKCCMKPEQKLMLLDVNCSKLVNLEIKYWRSPWRLFEECLINVNAPGLVYFKFVGHLARINFKENLPCLNKAFVDLLYPTSCAKVDLSDRMLRTAESFISMLRQMSSVKYLFLSPRTIEVLSTVPDLRVHSPTVFENLRFVKFIADDKYTETTLPVKTVRQLLETVKDETWTFDLPKELRQKKVKAKRKDPKPVSVPASEDANRVRVPANVMHYLLESSPSAESLCIEIPKVSSDENEGK